MKKILVGIVVAILLMPAVGVAKKDAKDIVGTYSVVGYNPGVPTSGDPSYKGVLGITQSGGAYLLNWKIGKQKMSGVGIYSDQILSVGFNGGVVSYKIEGNQLKGVWAPPTGGTFGYENCTKQ